MFTVMVHAIVRNTERGTTQKIWKRSGLGATFPSTSHPVPSVSIPSFLSYPFPLFPIIILYSSPYLPLSDSLEPKWEVWMSLKLT